MSDPGLKPANLDSAAGVQLELQRIEREYAELSPLWSRWADLHHRLDLRVKRREAELYLTLRSPGDRDEKVTDVRQEATAALWRDPLGTPLGDWPETKLLMEAHEEALGAYKGCDKKAQALEGQRSTCQTLLNSYMAMDTGPQQPQRGRR